MTTSTSTKITTTTITTTSASCSYSIPAGKFITPKHTFNTIVDCIRQAPRPVSLAEVSYVLTGNPHYQHYLNPVFSGKANAAKRRKARLTRQVVKGTSYWSILHNSPSEEVTHA